MSDTMKIRLAVWRALAARRSRLTTIDVRVSHQAGHLNTVQAVNTARHDDDCAPWQRQSKLGAVLMPRYSGRAYEMVWRAMKPNQQGDNPGPIWDGSPDP